MDTREHIEELRRVMGTLPNQRPELETKFLRGVEGIRVELIDHSVNPYKAMYVLATSCWGNKINKWRETPPRYRFEVVKAALQRQALPLALESPNFTFAVEGISRAGFDQLARTRVGAVFSAKGMRDNDWSGCSIRIPNALWPTEKEFSDYEDEQADQNTILKVGNFTNLEGDLRRIKELYHDIVNLGHASWQAARTVLPLYVVYGFSVSYNFMALSGVCSNRMKFCEMEDVVATAWLYREEVKKIFPLLASYLRPGCDFGGKCQYHKSYSLSEMFGCLFKECGRNPCPGSNEYAEFNQTCTDYHLLEEQLGIECLKPDQWKTYETYESLEEKDRVLFEAD